MSKKNRDSQDVQAPASGGNTRWADYFWANLIFFTFLFVLTYAVRLSCEAPGDEQTPAVGLVLHQTFLFIVALFGGGFLLVTLFDAAYEFFAGKAQEDVPAETTPKA